MKIKVTEKGVYDQKGKRVAVGTPFTVPGGVIPSWLVGKVVIIEGAPAKAQTIPAAKTAITNPAPSAPQKGDDDTGADKTGDDQSTGEGDTVSQMTDEELADYFKEAKGKAPHPQMKRENMEAAVREALKD